MRSTEMASRVRGVGAYETASDQSVKGPASVAGGWVGRTCIVGAKYGTPLTQKQTLHRRCSDARLPTGKKIEVPSGQSRALLAIYTDACNFSSSRKIDSPITFVPTLAVPGAMMSAVRNPEASTLVQARSINVASSSMPNE